MTEEGMATPPTFAVIRYDSSMAFTAIASAAIAAGNLVALDTANGTAKLATATGGGEQAVGIAAHAAVADGRLLILPACTVYDNSKTGLRGRPLYLVATGGYSETPLTGIADLRQLIGYGRTQNKVIEIAILPTPLEVQAAATSTVAFSN